MSDAAKISNVVPMAVDDDGTPLAGGERMTEVSPGVWMSPDAVALHDFLARTSLYAETGG